MNLGEFHDLVKSTANRGNTLDGRIPSQVNMAVQWMERNYTFKYMEQLRLFQIIAGDRTIELPTNGLIKAFKFVRVVNSDSSYSHLNKVEPEDLPGLRTSNSDLVVSNTYWIVGNRRLILSWIPSGILNGEAMWYEYTDWPTSNDAKHPLITIAADALLAQTMIFMAAFVLRDVRMFEVWKDIRNEAVNTLTRAEDETKYSGADISMVYRP